MASLKGVDIQRGTLGASVLGNKDAISGLLASGVAVSGNDLNGILGIAVGQTVKLTSLKDAESYGITADYDATNKVRVWHHIEEFYRMAGEGSTLYLMLYNGTPTNAMGEEYAKKMIADAAGEIRLLAVAYNPEESYNPTAVNGLEEDIYAAIKPAQELYDWSYETFRPCQIILEGRGFSATTSTAAADLRALKDDDDNVIGAYKVSICIGQDYNYAQTQDTVGQKYADVGTMLGMLASKKVNENIGEVANGNLMNVQKGKWTKAALSNHKSIADMDSQLQGLEDKGYVFAISYAGLDGVYFNNDHTCTPIIKDKEGYFNEYTISYGRVHDKAVRDLRTALLPRVKSSQPVDSKTGKLPMAIVKYFEAIGDEVFQTMKAEGLITEGKTKVDENSDLLISPRVLKVSFVVVPMGQIDEIRGTINLKTSI